MVSVRTTILTYLKKIGAGYPGPSISCLFLLFNLGKKILDQNYVEIDFKIGHVLVILRFCE